MSKFNHEWTFYIRSRWIYDKLEKQISCDKSNATVFLKTKSYLFSNTLNGWITKSNITHFERKKSPFFLFLFVYFIWIILFSNLFLQYLRVFMSCLLSFCDHYWYCFIFAVLWNIVHCVKVFDFVEVRSHIVWLLLLLNFVWAVSLFFPSFDSHFLFSFSFYLYQWSRYVFWFFYRSCAYVVSRVLYIDRKESNERSFSLSSIEKMKSANTKCQWMKKNEFNAKGKYPKRNSIKESNEETSE